MSKDVHSGKSERREHKKKKRRYPMSGRSVFTIARIQKTRNA